MLRLEGVTVRFDDAPRPAVDHVDLDVPPGTVLAVLGPSGCGKSTLLRAVAGLEPLAAGRVSYDGRDLADVPTHRRGFALMFQDGQLFGNRTVAGNVAYALRLRRASRREVTARVAELLELVGLGGLEARDTATLSGGERQRVALARSLAVEPRLLLLDEPLSSLDRSLRERLAGDLRDILLRAGTTAMLVTHDPEEAFAVADRMALMRAGRIVQHGTVEEVWAAPTDAEAARFLGYATILHGDAAATVQRAGGSGSPAPQLALRRSALAVSPDGPLTGRVVAARSAPDLLRLTVDVDGVGTVDAVAAVPAGTPSPGPGSTVRVAVDLARTAPLGDRGGTGHLP